jgi:hypothetical protein
MAQLLNKFRSFTEPEDSLSCSQKPATCAYSEPGKSSAHPSILRLSEPYLYYPPIYTRVSPSSLFPSG